MMDSSYGNLLSGHRGVIDGELLASCNMVSLTPFIKETRDSKILPVRRGYESALAKILAIRHLNTGNGSLISDIQGLDQRCPVQFGIDFVDTKLNIGVAGTRLARRMVNIDVPPCVFLGSTLSVVSATTSKFTAANGFPQISGASTGSFLDDAENYPLYSRTTPSTKGISRALVRYLYQELGVRRFFVIYIADSYGFHYWEDLQEAASELHNDSFEIEGISLLPDLSNLFEAIERAKTSGFDHVFVAVYGEYLNDHSLIEEAISQGIAGLDSNTHWIFGDNFLAPTDWVFDATDPLVDAYQQVSFFTANGSGSLAKPDGKYQEFTNQLKGLFDEGIFDSTNAVVQTQKSAPKKKKRKREKRVHIERTTILEPYLETMVSDPVDKQLATDFLDLLRVDETFLQPKFLSHETPYEYESVVMAGLAICNQLGTPSSTKLFVDAESFQNELVHTGIDGISGNVILDHTTGTRLENSTYYTMQNLLAEDFLDETEGIEKTRFWKRKTVELELIEAPPGGETDNTNDQTLGSPDDSNYQDGTTPPLPLPDMKHSPPPSISALQPPSPISIDENNFVRIIQGLSCALPIVASVGFIIWTYTYRKQPIVRASKPLFLYLMCFGVMIFSSASLPFPIVGTAGTLDSSSGGFIEEDFISTKTSHCLASIWLRTLGFAVIISALFAKTYRFNRVICGAKQYRSTRARVLADFIIPLVVMLITNILILSLMTISNPVTYGLIPEESYSTDDKSASESCMYIKENRYKFGIPLVCWNISILVFSLHQSWTVRNCDLETFTRFPSEGPQIFNALLSSLMVSLIGVLIMLVVRERGNHQTVTLVESTINLVFCILVLFAVFFTKIKHVWSTTTRQNQDLTESDRSHQHHKIRKNTNHGNESDSLEESSSRDAHRPTVSAHSRTKDELKAENACLHKRNLELEGEILLFPTYKRESKNTILKNFFGLIGAEDDFEDECSPIPLEATLTTDQEQQLRQEPKEALPMRVATTREAPRFHFKKIFDDIFFDSSDMIPSYSPVMRPIVISEETTSWSLARELRSLRSNLKSSTTSTSKQKSSSKSYFNSSSIYRASTTTTNSKTSTNKSSPESKIIGKKGSPESKITKSSSDTKSTPTPESDIPSSFFQSRRRMPESENHTTSPPEKTGGSLGSSMAPLGGSPLTHSEKFDYPLSMRQSPVELIQQGTNRQATKEFRRSFDSSAGLLSTSRSRNPRNSFDSSTAPFNNVKSRSVFRSSIDSSMVPLGDPSLPGASISTGIMEARSIFRPKRPSSGVGNTIAEENRGGGIPTHIFIPRHLQTVNIDDLDQQANGVLDQQIQPESSAHQSLASANASLSAPPPALTLRGTAYRRPSLGDDIVVSSPPKDPSNPFRRCI